MVKGELNSLVFEILFYNYIYFFCLYVFLPLGAPGTSMSEPPDKAISFFILFYFFC